MNSFVGVYLHYLCTIFLCPASLLGCLYLALPFVFFTLSLPCLYLIAHQTALLPMQLTAEMPHTITAMQLLAVFDTVTGHYLAAMHQSSSECMCSSSQLVPTYTHNTFRPCHCA